MISTISTCAELPSMPCCLTTCGTLYLTDSIDHSTDHSWEVDMYLVHKLVVKASHALNSMKEHAPAAPVQQHCTLPAPPALCGQGLPPPGLGSGGSRVGALGCDKVHSIECQGWIIERSTCSAQHYHLEAHRLRSPHRPAFSLSGLLVTQGIRSSLGNPTCISCPPVCVGLPGCRQLAARAWGQDHEANSTGAALQSSAAAMQSQQAVDQARLPTSVLMQCIEEEMPSLVKPNKASVDRTCQTETWQARKESRRLPQNYSGLINAVMS
ncbi:hypothetical protein HaLaN_25648 [Haematococcus lacustris]|uniref:Uncharacterized protein n=1 Tax=Haematococcus lacustris TaxID=44745 RepID=A0A699ZXG7_HAELA|nr:hypothetical protein HaLaN_25648 [Haematococcus lacustris]